MKTDRRNPWKAMLSKKRSSAQFFSSQKLGKKRILITWEDIRDQFERQDGRCWWLGVKINPLDIFESYNILAPSLDRRDNDHDYLPSNIVIATRFANLGRNTLSTDQFIPFVKELRKRIYGDMWPRFLFEEEQIADKKSKLFPPMVLPKKPAPKKVDVPQFEFAFVEEPVAG